MTIVTSKAAQERLETIRRQNVKRHMEAAAKTKLREDIRRATANRNAQIQRDSLLEASLRHNGLNQMAFDRLNVLKKVVR